MVNSFPEMLELNKRSMEVLSLIVRDEARNSYGQGPRAQKNYW
jgi:hypothetical protein